MARLEEAGTASEDFPPDLPAGGSRDELQLAADGVGPLFHRRYRVRIADSEIGCDELVERLREDPNRAAPSEFAHFQRVRGESKLMESGDEYVVRMPGPWDGPVRVIDATPTSFRLATLAGHLEAGQIEFCAHDGPQLTFTIESWARSGDRLSALLYDRLRMAKETQLHMWTSFLEQVVELSGGRRFGRLEIHTRRVDDGA